MIKSTFKDISFTGVFSWVTAHTQTEKYVEIISIPRDGKVKHVRVFRIALRGLGWGVGGMGSSLLPLGGGNLSKSDLETTFCKL